MGIEDRTQQREIDGYIYEVVPVQAAAGYKALLKFIKIASPVIQGFVGGGGDATKGAASAFTVLAQTLTDEDMKYYCSLFGPQTRFCEVGQESADCWVTLTPQQQELHFAARYMALFDWLKFCMEVNFGGFFGAAANRIAAVSPTPAQSSGSPAKTGSL